MIEEPLLLPTSVGPIAAILTLPDEAAKATVLVVPGAGGTRAGVNQLWTRVAHSVCERGVAVLRADYAGLGESWDADPRERSSAIRDLARWACDRTGDVPLLLVANCFGLMPAVTICRERRVAATAVMLPPVFPAGAHAPVAVRPSMTDRVQRSIGQIRRLPRRGAYRMRYGSARGLAWLDQADPGEPMKDLIELVSRTPTWLLMGSNDTCTEPVRRLLPTLEEHGHVEVTVLDGLVLRAMSTPETQEAICENILAWVTRTASRLAAPT